MSIIALFTWVLAACGGLYLVAVWLIEYDREFQGSASSRLPVPVICTHALLALGGLAVWGSYLLLGGARLAWTAVIVLIVVASLGMVMAIRWIYMYRAVTQMRLAAAPGGRAELPVPGRRDAGPGPGHGADRALGRPATPRGDDGPSMLAAGRAAAQTGSSPCSPPPVPRGAARSRPRREHST
jgi:hypothetical protein